MKLDPVRRTVVISLLLVPITLAAGAAPVSLDRPELAPLAGVARHVMPAVDVPALLAEDEANRDRPGIPFRVGFPMATDLAPATDGTWEDLPEGGRLWRLRVQSPDALWVVLGFGTFVLQPGGRMWVYDPSTGQQHGPFGAEDVRGHGQLWLPPIDGDSAVVELYWPERLRGETPRLHLGTVSHGYKSFGGVGGFEVLPDDDDPTTAGSGACNVDVNCPLGDNWQGQKRGVVRLLIGGSGLCSGSLISNTAADCTPYVLTARHCLSTQGSAASTTYRFNYETSGCGSGSVTTNQNLTGSSLVATNGPSDMTLLLLDSAPPEEWAPFFNGWSRSPSPGMESHGIHHPGGDVKKICFNNDPLIDGPGGGGWGSDHWRVTQWEIGTTEGGSSGSPLFDQDQRIVGQLHGGTASCSSITWDEYGKVDVSWNGGGTPASRLSDWLDPVGSGDVAVDGIDLQACLMPRPDLTVTDVILAERAGNGDGVPDPGESLEVRVMLGNEGNLMAAGVHGSVTTATPLVGVADPEASWSDIPESEQRISDVPHFNLQVDPGFGCGEPITVQLTADAVALEVPLSRPLELRIGDPLVEISFSDDFESGAGGFTSQSLAGSGSWGQTTADSQSGTTSWFIADTFSRLDTALVMPTVNALEPEAELTFVHRFDTENNRDGGVLEYDVGAGWQDAGPFLIEGGYNSAIGSSESSPLAGRSAWAGDSAGWKTVRVDLAAFAGSDLQLRWRFATNFFIGDDGWYLDDVRIDTTDFVCSPVAASPGEASAPAGSGAPFTIDRDPGGSFAMSWSAPPDGGAAVAYRLYRMPLTTPGAAPTCEADLGNTTSAVMSSLADDSAFLVVAANSVGEGSYGADGAGTDRSSATGGDICP